MTRCRDCQYYERPIIIKWGRGDCRLDPKVVKKVPTEWCSHFMLAIARRRTDK